MITISKLYKGDSVRSDNGSQIDLPIFGRYAAIVREDWLAVCKATDGDSYYVRLPMGSTMHGEWNMEEAIEQAQAFAASGYEGWVADREAAVAEAIADAKSRHNAKANASSSYAAKFGAAL